MKLKVKDMDISSGGPLIAIINEKDAKDMDLHFGDRIKIKKKGKIETVLLDIGKSKKSAGLGKIGLNEEVLVSLRLKHNDTVSITPARKPLSIDYIKRKMDGFKLTKKEIDQIVWDIVHNKLSQVELTYFVSACYFNELDLEETTLLTKAMTLQGDILKPNRYPVLDKHCVGGVAGNRTTMIIVPILAALGIVIPKTSSRSITSPAGTGDTMEVLSNVCVPIKRMEHIIKKTNGCIIWGGSLNLAPADDKIISVERPLAIDAKSQLLASVMAKKASVSSTHILVDIPSGEGSKIPSKKKALQLKKDFENLAKRIGVKVKVIITDGREPIGNGIGPALEARDVLWILKNDERGPLDLKRKSLVMSGLMIEMAGKAKKGNGIKLAREILNEGRAYNKMISIINVQGKKITDPDKIIVGKVSHDIKSKKNGTIKKISNSAISKIARVSGAPHDQGAGVYLYKHVNDKVKKGESIFRIYCHNKDRLDYTRRIMKGLDVFVIK
ncbi:MAG: AMP phosphorylase [Nanoarchaeota archaeon]|nr:AMP phosphorylase [Nanoarchaeota archaeon]